MPDSPLSGRNKKVADLGFRRRPPAALECAPLRVNVSTKKSAALRNGCLFISMILSSCFLVWREERNSVLPPSGELGLAWPNSELHFPACLGLVSPPIGGRPVPVASAWDPRRDETVRERGRPGGAARAGCGRLGPGQNGAAHQHRRPRR